MSLLNKKGTPIIDANSISKRKADEDANRKRMRYTTCIVAISRKIRELKMNMQEVLVVLDSVRDGCKNEAMRELKMNDYTFEKTKESEAILSKMLQDLAKK